MTERLHFHFSLFIHWRRKWQPTPVFLPGESQGWGSLVDCHLWGHTKSDTTEVTQQQQQQHIIHIIKHVLYVCSVAKLCLTFCNPMDCSLLGSPVQGILQARIPEWVAISSSMGSSLPRDRTSVCLPHWQADSLPLCHLGSPKPCVTWIPNQKAAKEKQICNTIFLLNTDAKILEQ